ncbi:class I SAM-dependent methyltransferase [Rhizobium lusitanum]|uniref:Methyltransferase domain-containing protein n=1 Tax=Rhizobium lusitanum TaxID=293958 RepID=A0A1C3VR57_9HYPH|nr:class I SAM-dependent methyltransferase [Rhizobium lusitanum]SCB30189.1 Methyltransferase domain-containing protein [Rhizobium lusitanum]
MKTIGKIHSSQIDRYVKDVDDRFGGVHKPGWLEFVSDFELTYETVVDITLDPFSEEFLRQQLNLHMELTGRGIDQLENEIVPVVVQDNAAGVNPYNSTDIRSVSRHAATLAIALRLASPPDAARILDLGVGAGMSSELLAYCGATVTSVDITPSFVELINLRAARFGYPIKAVQSNFDDYQDESGSYDMAMFFASLHHGIKPWEILEKISKLLKSDGKIALAAEPVQKLWWPYWGMRLDPESVYVARKYGWFESGWSEIFLRKMFHRIGFKLDITTVDPNLIEGQVIAIGSRSHEPLPEMSIGTPQIERRKKISFGPASDGLQYLTHGWSSSSDPWGIWSSGSRSGFLLHLPPGDEWTVSVEAHPMVSEQHRTQVINIDVNGVELKTSRLEANRDTLTMRRPAVFDFTFSRKKIGLSLGSNLVEVVFNYPAATKAQDIGRGNDPRTLAIGLVSLAIR